MPFAVGSKYELSYIGESSYGVTPNTPSMRQLRVTGDDLNLVKESFLSNELRSDREITDFRHGNRQVGGNLNFELSKDTGFDDLFLGLLGASAWSPVVYSANTIAFVNGAPDTITDSANGFVTAGIQVGDVITVSNTLSNNSVFTVTNVTAGTLTVAGTSLVDEAEGSATLTCARKFAKIGTTIKSYSMERRFTDIAVYQLLTGCRVSGMSLSIQPNSIVTGSFSMLGKDLVNGTSSVDAAPTVHDGASVMDSFSGTISEGGSNIAVVTSVELSVQNNLTPAFVVGSAELQQVLEERCNVSGTITAYLEDETLLEKFRDETETSLDLKISDGTNFYRFILPRLKYGNAATPVNGFGGVIVTLPFQAFRDATVGASLRIEKNS